MNTAPASGFAESVSIARSANAWAQVAPQLIPAGVLVTTPLPSPVLLTVRVREASSYSTSKITPGSLFEAVAWSVTLLMTGTSGDAQGEGWQTWLPCAGVSVSVMVGGAALAGHEYRWKHVAV